MAHTEDQIAQAAEYALGTLDAGERAEVETLAAVDKEFAAIVQSWQFRLAALNQMVGSVEPRPVVWERILAGIGQAAPPLAQDTAASHGPSQVPHEEPLADRTIRQAAGEGGNVVPFARRLRAWRSVAAVASALAAALLVTLSLQIYKPDALPSALRAPQRVQTVEVKVPQPVSPSPQYVALLQGQGGGPAFILTVDGATKTFTVRKVQADAEPGRSFELWLISDRLPRPRSLGVIGDAEFTTRPVLAGYDPALINSATYAVTVEPAGGSPTGQPTSAPVFSGKLIETVPDGAQQTPTQQK